MKKVLFGLIILCLLSAGKTALAQSIPVNLPLIEESMRNLQLKGGIDDKRSLMVRPVYGRDSFSIYSILGDSSVRGKQKNVYVQALPVWLKQQVNTHHPYGWNDGSMIQAKGYQSQLSAGVFFKAGPLTIQLQPELVFAQNPSFATFPVEHTDSIWKEYYTTLNWLDNPERMGDGTYSKVFAGQSSIRFNWKKLSIGASTENLWWGPGSRTALLMSNNAPGFPHFTFNTLEPVQSFLGSFEWQLIAGFLKGSGVLPPDTSRTFEGQPLYVPKPNGNRYINAFMISWQPKWVRGLHLGFSRSFYQYQNNINGGLNGYLPVVSSFFKGGSRDENSFGRDQLLSFHLRWIWLKEQSEIYFEFGRNDHSQNVPDFVMEPEHSSAFIIGLRKIFSNPGKKDIELMIELSNLEATKTGEVRDVPTWYQHHQVRHGYTHKGQILGSGLGPGGNSQTVGLAWFKPGVRTGFRIERIIHNNDFYYKAFGPMRNFESHWVDLGLNAFHSWYRKKFLYSANLSFVRSLNYQWRYSANPATLLDGKKSVNNLHLDFTVGYIF